MKVAVFYPISAGQVWSVSRGLCTTLTRMGYDVLDASINTVQHDQLVEQDLILVSGPEYMWRTLRERYQHWDDLPATKYGWLHETVLREDYDTNPIAVNGKLPTQEILNLFHTVFTPALQDTKYGFQYLPFGVDTEIFKPVPKIHTNLFIGSLYSKRREFLSKYPFVSVYKYMDFLMYKSRVSFAQYTEMTSEAQAVINLPMLTDANGTRVYEGLACRAFVVTPKGAAGDYSMFESGKHLMYYDDSPLEIIQKYFVPVYRPKQAGEFHLTEEAKSIAETGYQEVLHRHTLEQRLRTMLA
jgi:hypothetical protein